MGSNPIARSNSTEGSRKPAFERMLVFLFLLRDWRLAARYRQYFKVRLNIDTNPAPNLNEVAGARE
ncbi:hypothetical protein B0E33_13940 [Roseibium algicola]|uniref:Uncharacterized protein n=1 Tax=Roseibium algicola TaxID=2857014 RepID=A0ABN4WS44_9HYPH|nr:hypothetical protein B0E33_13940 [Roseibium aggregatum]